jgi:hypothetical protein
LLTNIEKEFSLSLSQDRSDEEKRMIFAHAVLFLMRDDYDGQLIFDAWEVGRVIKMLAVSANIKASWEEIDRFDNRLDKLFPEMKDLVDRLIVFKALIDDKETWQRFEALLPDRFLKAVWRAFNRPKADPQFYKNTNRYNWQITPKSKHAELLFLKDKRT